MALRSDGQTSALGAEFSLGQGGQPWLGAEFTLPSVAPYYAPTNSECRLSGGGSGVEVWSTDGVLPGGGSEPSARGGCSCGGKCGALRDRRSAKLSRTCIGIDLARRSANLDVLDILGLLPLPILDAHDPARGLARLGRLPTTDLGQEVRKNTIAVVLHSNRDLSGKGEVTPLCDFSLSLELDVRVGLLMAYFLLVLLGVDEDDAATIVVEIANSYCPKVPVPYPDPAPQCTMPTQCGCWQWNGPAGGWTKVTEPALAYAAACKGGGSDQGTDQKCGSFNPGDKYWVTKPGCP